MLSTSWLAKDETTPTTTPAGAALASASYPSSDNIWTELEIAVSVNSVTATGVRSVNLNWQIPREPLAGPGRDGDVRAAGRERPLPG
jgi:hypothetical protein